MREVSPAAAAAALRSAETARGGRALWRARGGRISRTAAAGSRGRAEDVGRRPGGDEGVAVEAVALKRRRHGRVEIDRSLVLRDAAGILGC